MKFDLGRILVTPGSLTAVNSAVKTPREYLLNHARGEWGRVGAADAALNDQAVEDGSRILSAYTLPSGLEIRIITEAADDGGRRAATTVPLPEEY